MLETVYPVTAIRYMYDPRAQNPKSPDAVCWESILMREENQRSRRKTPERGWDWWSETQPTNNRRDGRREWWPSICHPDSLRHTTRAFSRQPPMQIIAPSKRTSLRWEEGKRCFRVRALSKPHTQTRTVITISFSSFFLVALQFVGKASTCLLSTQCTHTDYYARNLWELPHIYR